MPTLYFIDLPSKTKKRKSINVLLGLTFPFSGAIKNSLKINENYIKDLNSMYSMFDSKDRGRHQL